MERKSGAAAAGKIRTVARPAVMVLEQIEQKKSDIWQNLTKKQKEL